MPMLPKRTKFRKQMRGKLRGNATRGNYVAYGDFGLQSLEAHWLTARQIEAGRIAAQHFLRRQGKIYIRVFPDKPVSKKPLETRMGKGKAEVDYWAARIKPHCHLNSSLQCLELMQQALAFLLCSRRLGQEHYYIYCILGA